MLLCIVSDKYKKTLTVEEWAEHYTVPIISQVYHALREEEDGLGPACKELFTGMFISGFVAALVFDALTQLKPPKTSALKKFEMTTRDFNEVKLKIQESVADGFSRAFKEFTGKGVDYYCQVRAIPEPTNKEPC